MNIEYEAKCKEAIQLLGGTFTRFPNQWFTVLLKDEGKKSYDEDGEHIGIYKAVPHSFWKFLYVLFHEVMWGRTGKTSLSAELSLRQFGIRPKEAMMWATAVVAGGLFSVQKGTFSSRKASTYIYRPADSLTWQGFYRGLMTAYGEWRASRSISREQNYGEKMQDWAKLVKTRVTMETAILRKQLGVRGAGATNKDEK